MKGAGSSDQGLLTGHCLATGLKGITSSDNQLQAPL